MRQTVIADSSQLSTIFECEQKHAYEYVESLTEINQQKPELTFQVPDKIAMGSLGHKYLEIYYKCLGTSKDAELAARTALDFDPDKEDKVDPEFPLDPKNRKIVRDRFCDYLLKYSAGDYSVGTRYVTEIQVQDGWLKDVQVPESLVEQGFSYELYNTSEYLFVLEGRIDFIGHQRGESLWMDHKWQLRQRNLYGKSIQFRNYALVTGFPLGVINYVRLKDKVDATTLVRQPIAFNPGEMRAWKEELTEMYIHIAKRQRQADYPQQNRSACPGKFGYECQFTSLCDLYDPRQRQSQKQLYFTKKKEWKPW